MAPKVFLLRCWGLFASLYDAHPDYEYTLQVRSSLKGALIAAKYPSVNLVYVDNNSSDIIASAAAAVDIVIRAAGSTDDVPSATAIAAGLKAGHSESNQGIWIHISGTGELCWHDMKEGRWGEPPLSDERYDDVADIKRIVHGGIPDDAIHRDVDKIVQAANSSQGVKTAIVNPPYDLRPRPWSGQSAKYAGVRACCLHTDNGPFAWGEVAERVGQEAYKQGFIQDPKTVRTDLSTLTAETGVSVTWGLNSKSVASRARKYLAWRPRQGKVTGEIADMVAGEAKRLNIPPRYQRK